MKTKFKFNLKAILCFIIAFSTQVTASNAQGGNKNDNILFPQVPLPFYFGGEVGYSVLLQQVNFAAGDKAVPCVEFTEATGGGLTLGAKAIIYLTPDMFVQPKLRFEFRNTTMTKAAPPEKIRNSSNELSDVNAKYEVRSNFQTACLDALLGYEIAETGAYLFAGGSVGYFLNKNFSVFQVLDNAEAVYSLSGTNELELVKDAEYPNFNSLALDARGGVGYMYPLNNRMSLNAEAFYSFPTQSLLTDPYSLKQSGIHFGLGFLYNLNIDKYED